MSRWTHDSQHFLLEHFDVIHNSPSHIYHSALPLSPPSSQLYKCYTAEIPDTIKVVKGLPAEWGVCSRTVMLESITWDLSCHNNSIAVGSKPGDIIILNAITGSQTTVLSGHADEVRCLAFSPDGASLASGGDDNTVKLWDLQTGGVVRTFSGHTNLVQSVSISADYTTIASGSRDTTVCLWNIQTGECQGIIYQQDSVWYINFCPSDPEHLISICSDQLWQWNTNGDQIKPPFGGSHIAFSSDGTQFVSCCGSVVTVQSSNSGAIVLEFQVTNSDAKYCCFSPDGSLVAIASDNTAYVWDITNSNPHLIETFVGHYKNITCLAFSSPTTLISASEDRSVKFWQIRAPSIDPVVISPEYAPLTSAPIKSITLHTEDNIIVTSDSDGIVKTWDLSTGLCKTSFQTPAKNFYKGDVRLINGRLIFVWSPGGRAACVWDTGKGELLLKIVVRYPPRDLRISGDGSRVLALYEHVIYVWSIQTGEIVDQVAVSGSDSIGSLTVDGSKAWAYWSQSIYQGWDFGIPGLPPVQLSNMPMLPNSNMLWDPSQTRIKNAATGEVVFQLSGRLAGPVDVQCDGTYLVAGYESGEVLILDIEHVLL